MIKKCIPNNQGSITLLTIFLTSMFLLLFAFADYAMAIKEKVMTRNDVITEQAFYAANSCLEEGYLKLRTDANYNGDTITVAGANCKAKVNRIGNSTTGTLEGEGTAKDKIRVIASVYKDAGPTAGAAMAADIYHVLDRSRSMAAHCSPGESWMTRLSCESHGSTWSDITGFAALKPAAVSFIDYLDVARNQIGVISYSDVAQLEFVLDDDYDGARDSIEGLDDPIGSTNIGDAISLAHVQLMAHALPGRQKVMLLMTDGKPTRPLPLATAPAYALTNAQAAKANGIKIITIGLGPDVDHALMRQIATEVNGVPLYFHAPTPSDLQDVYDQIGNILVSYGIQQGSWQEK